MLTFDNRRNVFIGKNTEEAILFAVEHWLDTAKRSIQQRGRFCVALSGGSTPKAIYQKVILDKDLDWSKISLFWSDERKVPADHPESNYHMAMEFFRQVPIPPSQIFRMQAEKGKAEEYEEKIHHYVGKHLFDLVMLGVGEDGHTASLFPETAALSIEDKLVVMNEVPSKNTERMTFTFPCIQGSRNIAIYALGKSKQEIVEKVLHAPIISPYPASRLGTAESPALWVLDHPVKINF